MNIETITEFLGWCTVINFGLLIFDGLAWILLKESLGRFGARIFGVTSEELNVAMLRGYVQYTASIFVLNLVPFIALKIMAGS